MVEEVDYNSTASLMAYMQAKSIAMRKQYGQNFLINPDARKRLAHAVMAQSREKAREGIDVWEVGPGLGCMTAEFLQAGARVKAFEIDKAFIASLRTFFGGYISSGKLEIVEGDVLKTLFRCPLPAALNPLTADIPPLTIASPPPASPVLFGNLPYNIAATLMGSMIERGAEAGDIFDRCVITVQKEVAERMTAKPAAKDYSSISVVCQWAYKIRPLMDIKASSFWPRPNVASRSLVFERRDDFPACTDAKLFVRMTRALFASRRKTVRNNLAPFLPRLCIAASAQEVLDRAGIKASVRAETLDIKTLLHLCDTIATETGRKGE